jgi:para-nitrobenzyl esterase
VETSPIAETTAGRIRGFSRDGIAIFRGAPYGADTSGRRFRPALPPEPWPGVRDATAYGPQSPQIARRGGGLISGIREEPSSEDCLVLNVYTPALRDGAKRPVMVWLHGGGYTSLSGSAPTYDGVNLCRRGDVVVVTLNHRLNVFGYLYLPELLGDEFAQSGHVGMLDIMLALGWVRDNIAEFGGDPANVMIFGESGGGGKAMTLMAMPAAKGLFHKAAVQSGSLLINIERGAARANARAFLDAVDLTPATADKLLTLPFERLTAALPAMGEGPGAKHNLGPVVDGDILPAGVVELQSLALMPDVPLLVGTNTDEMTLLFGMGDKSLFDLAFDELPARLEAYFPSMDGKTVAQAVRAARPTATAADIFFAVSAERMFRQTSIVQAERKTGAGGAPAWHYEMAFASGAMGPRMGATHAMEIPLVFDNVARGRAMVGEGPEAQALADQMAPAWLAFARSGDPNHPALPAWRPYDAATRATMIFDVNPRVEHDRQGDLRRILHGLPLHVIDR